MTADRKTEAPQTGKSQPARKAWTPKTPVDVVLEQITKQEKKVAELREALKKEEATLAKLSRAKTIFEAS